MNLKQHLVFIGHISIYFSLSNNNAAAWIKSHLLESQHQDKVYQKLFTLENYTLNISMWQTLKVKVWNRIFCILKALWEKYKNYELVFRDVFYCSIVTFKKYFYFKIMDSGHVNVTCFLTYNTCWTVMSPPCTFLLPHLTTCTENMIVLSILIISRFPLNHVLSFLTRLNTPGISARENGHFAMHYDPRYSRKIYI